MRICSMRNASLVDVHSQFISTKVQILTQHLSHAKLIAHNPIAAGDGQAPAAPRQHTSAYVSIRQHTSAYVRIRQHTATGKRLVSIRQHTSAYVSIRIYLLSEASRMRNINTSAYVSTRAYIRQHTCAYTCCQSATSTRG